MIERSYFEVTPPWCRLSPDEQDELYELIRLPDYALSDEILRRREVLCMGLWGINIPGGAVA